MSFLYIIIKLQVCSNCHMNVLIRMLLGTNYYNHTGKNMFSNQNTVNLLLLINIIS